MLPTTVFGIAALPGTRDRVDEGGFCFVVGVSIILVLQGRMGDARLRISRVRVARVRISRAHAGKSSAVCSILLSSSIF
jgi:hypothetical protein